MMICCGVLRETTRSVNGLELVRDLCVNSGTSQRVLYLLLLVFLNADPS